MKYLPIFALLLLVGCAPTVKTVSLGPLSITSQPAEAPEAREVYVQQRPIIVRGWGGPRWGYGPRWGGGWHRGRW